MAAVNFAIRLGASYPLAKTYLQRCAQPILHGSLNMQPVTSIERLTLASLVVLVSLAAPLVAWSQQLPVPDVSHLALPSRETSVKITPALLKSKGLVNVWVELESPALARAHANARNSGKPLTRAEQYAHHQ